VGFRCGIVLGDLAIALVRLPSTAVKQPISAQVVSALLPVSNPPLVESGQILPGSITHLRCCRLGAKRRQRACMGDLPDLGL